MINGIILAGGLSKRMGKDKGLMEWHDKTLIEHTCEKMALICDKIIIVTNRPQDYQQVVGDLTNVSIIEDEIKQLGPLSGIHAGLGATDADYNIVVACDMPWMQPARYLELAADCMKKNTDLVITRTADGRYQSLHAVYHRKCRQPIEEMLKSGKLRMRDLIEKVNVCQINVSQEEARMFQNVNTPEEYRVVISQDK